MKKLAVGISTFSEIIREDYLYIDKTQDIYNLITSNKTAFLSRPRRFGKSLLISTLEEIFSGNKELFKGLAIYSTDYNWKKYPIIKLDFSEIESDSTESFKENINSELEDIAAEYNITLTKTTISSKFKELIKEVSKIDNVVILIDEYDDPILNNLDNIKVLKANHKTVRSFYKVIKSNSSYIHKIIVTGITKVAKASLFSGANNLEDISIDDKYQTIVGYTQSELELYFKEYIEDTAKFLNKTSTKLKEDLKFWYNGYNFAQNIKKVYNPFSIALFFKNSTTNKDPFKNYWIQSGTPNYLYTVAKNNLEAAADITKNLLTEKPANLSLDSLNSFEPEKVKFDALLFQAGYLTITNYENGKYEVYFPNHEVRDALENYLVTALFDQDKKTVFNKINIMRKSLEDNDLTDFFYHLQSFLYALSYTTLAGLKGFHKEAYYHTIVQEAFFFLELNHKSEDHTNKGRIDLLLETEEYVYIFELKRNTSAKTALEQIETKKYHEKYLHLNKIIVLVGVSINKSLKISWKEKTHLI